VQVHSGGGSISIRGLDGALSIDSGGGDVALQCTQNMRQAIIRSHGGDVSVFAQPDMQIQLHASGGKGVQIQEGCEITGPHSQSTPTMVQGLLQMQGETRSPAGMPNTADGLASTSMRSERAEPSKEALDSPAAAKPLLVVAAGDGEVKVLVRSWRDSMLHRFLKKSAAA
jgi:hypothetical protein